MHWDISFVKPHPTVRCFHEFSSGSCEARSDHGTCDGEKRQAHNGLSSFIKVQFHLDTSWKSWNGLRTGRGVCRRVSLDG